MSELREMGSTVDFRPDVRRASRTALLDPGANKMSHDEAEAEQVRVTFTTR
jgi:hypothetical protein